MGTGCRLACLGRMAEGPVDGLHDNPVLDDEEFPPRGSAPTSPCAWLALGAVVGALIALYWWAR